MLKDITFKTRLTNWKIGLKKNPEHLLSCGGLTLRCHGCCWLPFKILWLYKTLHQVNPFADLVHCTKSAFDQHFQDQTFNKDFVNAVESEPTFQEN